MRQDLGPESSMTPLALNGRKCEVRLDAEKQARTKRSRMKVVLYTVKMHAGRPNV